MNCSRMDTNEKSPYGDNSITANWAYYFIYNVFGWGFLWIKILLVQCNLWNVPHFLPFLHGREGYFIPNKCFAAFLLTLVFSTFIWIVGYWIWEDPVPISESEFDGSVFFCIDWSQL